VACMERRPTHAFVVHGDEERAVELARRLQTLHGLAGARAPRQGESVEL